MEAMIIVRDPVCPKCGATELHKNGKQVLIRGFKIYENGHWWSQCLVCSGGYDKIDGTFNKETHNPEKGWF